MDFFHQIEEAMKFGVDGHKAINEQVNFFRPDNKSIAWKWSLQQGDKHCKMSI